MCNYHGKFTLSKCIAEKLPRWTQNINKVVYFIMNHLIKIFYKWNLSYDGFTGKFYIAERIHYFQYFGNISKLKENIKLPPICFLKLTQHGLKCHL